MMMTMKMMLRVWAKWKKTTECIVLDVPPEKKEVNISAVLAGVLQDDNPRLQALLGDDGAKRRRRSSKGKDASFVLPTIAGTSTAVLKTLAAPTDAAQVTPKAFRDLTQTIKDKQKAAKGKRGKGKREGKGKRKGGKAKKQGKKRQTKAKGPTTAKDKASSSTSKAKPSELDKVDFKTYLNRMHSNAWHTERTYQMKELGLDKADASKKATRKAAEVTKKIREDKLAGKLPAYVVV